MASNPKIPLLVFNSRRILSFIAASAYEIGKISDIRPDCITKASRGDLISTGNYYFRYFDKKVEVEISDVGELTLEEYDKLCGVERKLCPTKDHNRKKRRITKTTNNEINIA